MHIKKSQGKRNANSNTSNKPPLLRLGVLAFTVLLSISSLILPISTRASGYTLNIGDVAPQDIQAPENLTYTSAVLTEIGRVNAENAVDPVYDSADPSITRRQIERLRIALNYISAIRLDIYATEEQKINDLASMVDLSLDQETIKALLIINDARWEIASQEAINVLEQVLRKTIRDDQLNETRQSIPALISFSIPEDQAIIISRIVAPFVVSNSLYNEPATNAAKIIAREYINPISTTYIQGQIIVNRGSVITAVEREALENFGLIEPPRTVQTILAAVSIVVLLSTLSVLYFRSRSLAPIHNTKGFIATAIVFLIFLLGSRLAIPNRAVIPYIFPIPAFGLTIASLYSIEAGVILSLSLSVMGAFDLSYSLDLTLYFFISTICGILILGKGKRVINFFWAGLAIGISGSAVILAYRLGDSNVDLIGIATLLGAAFLNGMASASLTLLLQFLFSHTLGLATPLQLLDLSRSDHPLLQHMLRNIPGSYQHSLQVANLAEQAAEAIGADSLLTRVGALYHDAGKVNNPSFFVENQPPGQINTHDDLDPAQSASLIIKHVMDGIQLAHKYRLPPRVQDFIREHHGTLLTRYQYSKALALAQNNHQGVNENLFRYPGPRPRSRETALLMLADGCEARVRAELPQTETELRAIVQKTIDYCQNESQLDKTTLTLNDLYLARESFVKTLQNTYHPRMKYPELTPPNKTKSALEDKE
jgi:putative nucleotidyltransferase with HDIG domain